MLKKASLKTIIILGIILLVLLAAGAIILWKNNARADTLSGSVASLQPGQTGTIEGSINKHNGDCWAPDVISAVNRATKVSYSGKITYSPEWGTGDSRYAVYSVPAGTYDIYTEKTMCFGDDAYGGYCRAKPASVTVANPTNTANLLMEPYSGVLVVGVNKLVGCNIGQTCVRQVANAKVTITDSAGKILTKLTDNSGRATFKDITKGSYTIKVYLGDTLRHTRSTSVSGCYKTTESVSLGL